MRVNRPLNEIYRQANAAALILRTGGELDAAGAAYHILLTDKKFEGFDSLHMTRTTDPRTFARHSETYNAWIYEALSTAISRADTIVGTTYAAYKLAAQHLWQANIIIHDDAARVPESETILVWACFPEAYIRITVGDPKQSPGMSSSSETSRVPRENVGFIAPFSLQGNVSFMERAACAGIQTIYLRYNYRTKFGLAALSSKQFYDDIMIQASTDVTSPDENRALEWLHGWGHGMKGARLWIDVEGKTETHEVSTYNTAHANIIVDLIVSACKAKLSRNGKRFLILVLTPYRDQVDHIKSHLQRLSPMEYCAERVEVRTVRGAIGYEGDLVILDWTRSNGPGFTGQPWLVNVGTTRSTCLEIHVGNSAIFNKNVTPTPYIKHIHSAFKEAQDNHSLVTVKGDLYMERCPFCYECHKEEDHLYMRCGFCEPGMNHHNTRRCPQKHLHPPMSPQVIVTLIREPDVVRQRFNNVTTRGKTYKGNNRGKHGRVGDSVTTQGFPSKRQQGVGTFKQQQGSTPKETRVSTDNNILTTMSSIGRSAYAAKPSDIENFPLYDSGCLPTDLVRDDVIMEDFDDKGDPIIVMDGFLSNLDQNTTMCGGDDPDENVSMG